MNNSVTSPKFIKKYSIIYNRFENTFTFKTLFDIKRAAICGSFII